MLGAIGDAIGKIGDVVGSVVDVAKGIMDSPLGGLIAAVFPPAGAIAGGLNMAGMVADIASQIGGGEDY